jgi:ABC-type dipeptide/oligopeptide/nickel transport system permease component
MLHQRLAAGFFRSVVFIIKLIILLIKNGLWKFSRELFSGILKIKGTSKNQILRAAALRLTCLPRFVTIRRYFK